MPERYAVSNRQDEIYYEHMQRYVFAQRFAKDRKILDVACGSGYGSYFLAANGAQHVDGVDISKKAISHCHLHYHKDNLTFNVMDGVSLKLTDNSFDMVVSFETIEHIRQPDLFLSELKRVLKPDGILIISTPNKAIYGLLGGDAHDFHVKEFLLDEFKELLNKFFDVRNLYGQKRSEYYDKKIIEYEKKTKEKAQTNIFLKSNPLKLKNLIPDRIRRYLSGKITGLVVRSPEVSSFEDLVISEVGIEESKFFLAIATPRINI